MMMMRMMTMMMTTLMMTMMLAMRMMTLIECSMGPFANLPNREDKIKEQDRGN